MPPERFPNWRRLNHKVALSVLGRTELVASSSYCKSVRGIDITWNLSQALILLILQRGIPNIFAVFFGTDETYCNLSLENILF